MCLMFYYWTLIFQWRFGFYVFAWRRFGLYFILKRPNLVFANFCIVNVMTLTKENVFVMHFSSFLFLLFYTFFHQWHYETYLSSSKTYFSKPSHQWSVINYSNENSGMIQPIFPLKRLMISLNYLWSFFIDSSIHPSDAQLSDFGQV